MLFKSLQAFKSVARSAYFCSDKYKVSENEWKRTLILTFSADFLLFFFWEESGSRMPRRAPGAFEALLLATGAA